MRSRGSATSSGAAGGGNAGAVTASAAGPRRLAPPRSLGCGERVRRADAASGTGRPRTARHPTALLRTAGDLKSTNCLFLEFSIQKFWTEPDRRSPTQWKAKPRSGDHGSGPPPWLTALAGPPRSPHEPASSAGQGPNTPVLTLPRVTTPPPNGPCGQRFPRFPGRRKRPASVSKMPAEGRTREGPAGVGWDRTLPFRQARPARRFRWSFLVTAGENAARDAVCGRGREGGTAPRHGPTTRPHDTRGQQGAARDAAWRLSPTTLQVTHVLRATSAFRGESLGRQERQAVATGTEGSASGGPPPARPPGTRHVGGPAGSPRPGPAATRPARSAAWLELGGAGWRGEGGTVRAAGTPGAR